MAQIVSVNVYGSNGYALLGGNQTFGFPVSRIIIRPAQAGLVLNGVAMLTTIQLLPMGTKVGQDQYQSPTALATVISAANL